MLCIIIIIVIIVIKKINTPQTRINKGFLKVALPVQVYNEPVQVYKEFLG